MNLSGTFSVIGIKLAIFGNVTTLEAAKTHFIFQKIISVFEKCIDIAP